MPNESRSNRPRKLADLLDHAGHDLAALRQRAADIDRLARQVRSRLPAPLRPHCLSVSLQGDCLVIFTDSPAWSSRLRYQAPELLQELDHPDFALRTVRVRVMPPAAAQAKPATATRRAHMSPSGAETLERTARSIGDAPLSAALLRLSRHGRRPG
jgi:hypothetical protein